MSKLKIEKQYVTEKKELTEKDLLLGILWEGDLELHTNKERMKTNSFGERIFHGDTILSIILGLFQNNIPQLEIVEFTSAYKQPVFIGESIWGSFRLVEKNDTSVHFEFVGLKENEEVVSTGTVKLIKGGDKN